jgi:two-component system nitrogen regulation sensor histidine kinase NtrY
MGSSPGAINSRKRDFQGPQRSPFSDRIIRLIILLAAPGILVTGILIWLQPWASQLKSTLLVAEVFLWVLIGAALRDYIIRPLQTLANVVGALREEDYSVRVRSAFPNDALGELAIEVNMLADLLAQHRTDSLEATALLQRIVEEVDVPIFAFEPGDSLRLVNSAGEALLRQSSAKLLGKTAADLELQNALTCENETLVSLRFAGDGRWLVRRSSFRQQGVPHTLLVLSDVSRALREQERRTWQNLIRVMGHELNNSLTPIKSIAGSLNTRLSTMDVEPDQRQDFERGLSIIETRAASLNRFLQAYRQLAQMPPPVLQPCSISALVKRVAALETRVEVTVNPGPDATLMADPDQIEQMLINLLRNAAEAALEPQLPEENSNGSQNRRSAESGPQIVCAWQVTDKDLTLTIEDNGLGLMNPSNVFVPFYTTKPSGSGIGLLLSRQISEAHGGFLELANRSGHRGCAVKVILPRIIPQ